MNETKTKTFEFILRKTSPNKDDTSKNIHTKIKNIKGERFFSIHEFKKKLEESHFLNKQNPRVIANLFPSTNKNTTFTSFNFKSRSSVKSIDEYKPYKPNSTLTDFNSLKTTSNVNCLYTENIEQEIKPLINNYYFNDEYPSNIKSLENNFKESKIDFIKKYNLFKQSRPKDLKFQINNNKISRNQEERSLHMKTEFFVLDEYFKNPINSFDKLNINKFIVDNCTSIIEKKKTDAYMDRYNAEVEKQGKIRKMNNVRISISHDKNMILQTEESISHNRRNEGDHKNKEKPKYLSMINKLANLPNDFFQKDFSRDNLLSNIEMQGYFLSHHKNKPKGRTQATVILIQNKIYIFGGVSCEGLDDMWRYDIKENTWKVLKPKSLEEFPLARYGHTSVHLKEKNEIYTFGGILNNSNSPYRDFILIYDVEGDKYFLEKCKNRSDVPLRRNHIAEVIGPHMLIHGGIDENDNILSDVCLLEFSPVCSWSKAEFKTGSKPLALANHSSTLVVKSDIRNSSNFNIYKFPELSQNSYSNRKLKIEGVYIFGGIDAERNTKNDLKVMRIGKRPIDFVTIKTKGYTPLPRMNATLNFFEHLNILILIGGKDDSLSKLFYNDLHVFDLENFTWINVKIFDKLPLERAEHSSVIHGNKIFIFGGINMNKYVGSDFYVINLDFWDKKRRKPVFKK